MERKTKILAVGDLHGDIGLVKRLSKKADKENIDIVIISGDLTREEESIENLVGPFVKRNRHILLIPGNHESAATIDFLSEMYPNTKNLHGYSFTKNGIGIFGAGTANIGPHQIGDENIFKLLEKAHSELREPKIKIMVTHIHPYGGKAEMFGFPGSQSVRKAIEKFKPSILISSHIHEAGGLQEKIDKTKVFNVSRKERVFEI